MTDISYSYRNMHKFTIKFYFESIAQSETFRHVEYNCEDAVHVASSICDGKFWHNVDGNGNVTVIQMSRVSTFEVIKEE